MSAVARRLGDWRLGRGLCPVVDHRRRAGLAHWLILSSSLANVESGYALWKPS
jgi:hypothetical protein